MSALAYKKKPLCHYVQYKHHLLNGTHTTSKLTSHTHFWFHHTIKWSGNPAGPRSPAGFPQNINFTVQHMTGVGVFRFINREITRGQGFVWHVSVCYNTNRHGCLSLGQKPYGLQQLINIFVDVKQDFYILHLDLLYLALQHLGHVKISSACCGYKHLETPFSHRVGFLKGKVCVPIMNYNLHFQ